MSDQAMRRCARWVLACTPALFCSCVGSAPDRDQVLRSDPSEVRVLRRYVDVEFIHFTSVTKATDVPPESAPMPPVTMGYQVELLDAAGRVVVVTGSPLDLVHDDEAEGARRYPPMLKASLLNGVCGGGGGRSQPLQTFCEGKTFLFCQGFLADHGIVVPMGAPLQERCRPYNMWQADGAVRFVRSKSDFPKTSTEPRLFCACEGRAVTGDDDIGAGDTSTGCSNHWVCQLIGPAGASS
jgi:hypothetical protein